MVQTQTKLSKNESRQAKSVYKATRSLGETAETFGVSIPTVRKAILDAGGKINHVGRPKKQA